jgi:hypothetical protein
MSFSTLRLPGSRSLAFTFESQTAVHLIVNAERHDSVVLAGLAGAVAAGAAGFGAAAGGAAVVAAAVGAGVAAGGGVAESAAVVPALALSAQPVAASASEIIETA